MDMAMMNGLASGFPYVDANIETGNADVFCLDSPFRFFQEPHAGVSLRLIQVKEIRYMSLGYNQHMMVGDGIPVLKSETQFILKQNVPGFLSGTEGARDLTMAVGFPQHPKIRGVPIPFLRVAAVAERLQVREVIASPMVSGDDVIHFKCAFTVRDTAEFAPSARTLENLVLDGARNVTQR
jgi:hypothetical protein